MSNQMIEYLEVVKTIDLMPISMEVGDDLRFRIEIVKNSSNGECCANLWRIENYRIHPSFPQKNGEPDAGSADEEICVKDIETLGSIKVADEDKALQLALEIMKDKFT